jgi:co-chaperonin GroES (HSP10)
MENIAHKFSFIEDHEEQEAKEFIEKHLGFPAPRMAGYHMAVKIYVRPEDIHTFVDENTGETKSIYLPHTVTAHDKYRSCTALIVSMGPEAYKHERFKESGPWCKVGDWVVIPRNEGTQVNYRGVPMQFIPDDRVLAIVEDPTHVTRD